MRTKSFIRISVYVVGILLIIGILAISVTRQHLYAPSSQDLKSRANLSVNQRINELREWPPTPDNPLYLIRMLGDQITLCMTPMDAKPELKLKLADERLHSAQKLLTHKRTSLALTTLTKSTKYVLSAAQDASKLSPQSSSQIRGMVKNSIRVQISELSSLKESFSDEQKPVVDGLLLQLDSLRATFL